MHLGVACFACFILRASVQPLPATDNEFRLLLHEGQLVSPLYYSWLKRGVAQYVFDATHFDPYMYGISLQHQQMIYGETPLHRFGSRIPSVVLQGERLYLYQLPGESEWGMTWHTACSVT